MGFGSQRTKLFVLSFLLLFSLSSWGGKHSKASPPPSKVIPLSFYRSLGRESFQVFKVLFFQPHRQWNSQSVEDLGIQWLNQNLKDYHLSQNLPAYQFDHLLASINASVRAFEQDHRRMKNLKIRTEYQELFIGLLRAVQVASEYNVGLNRESYLKLTDQIYSQTLEIFDNSSGNFNFLDLFWDYQFLRALRFPTDLTKVHVERLEQIERNFPEEKKIYSGWIASLSYIALEKDHFIRHEHRLYTEKLYSLSYDYFAGKADAPSLRRLQKAYLRAQSKGGAQEQIYKVRNELARQQISTSFSQLWSGFSLSRMMQFFSLCIGYVFIALPLEIILLFLASAMLWYQGKSSLPLEEKQKMNFAQITWVTFMRSYTGSNVNFYTKLASSLILFGIGLYFNSAKNLLESFITSPY